MKPELLNAGLIGTFVISKSGRDAGKCYVIINSHNEYVYLVDGKIRTLDYPKKKNLKHVNRLNILIKILPKQ